MLIHLHRKNKCYLAKIKKKKKKTEMLASTQISQKPHGNV